MKIVVLIARILLGLIFVIFGANLMYPFIPIPPPPPGPVRDFTTVLAVTHYAVVVGFFQFLGGFLLLINRYVAIGLIILAAELVNILTTHILVMHGQGLVGPPILVVLCWLLVFWRHRSAFAGIFEARLSD
jgi:putative oxidoreductase